MLASFFKLSSGLLSFEDGFDKRSKSANRSGLFKYGAIGGNINPVLENGVAILKNKIDHLLDRKSVV